MADPPKAEQEEHTDAETPARARTYPASETQAHQNATAETGHATTKASRDAKGKVKDPHHKKRQRHQGVG